MLLPLAFLAGCEAIRTGAPQQTQVSLASLSRVEQGALKIEASEGQLQAQRQRIEAARQEVARLERQALRWRQHFSSLVIVALLLATAIHVLNSSLEAKARRAQAAIEASNEEAQSTREELMLEGLASTHAAAIALQAKERAENDTRKLEKTRAFAHKVNEAEALVEEAQRKRKRVSWADNLTGTGGDDGEEAQAVGVQDDFQRLGSVWELDPKDASPVGTPTSTAMRVLYFLLGLTCLLALIAGTMWLLASILLRGSMYRPEDLVTIALEPGELMHNMPHLRAALVRVPGLSYLLQIY